MSGSITYGSITYTCKQGRAVYQGVQEAEITVPTDGVLKAFFQRVQAQRIEAKVLDVTILDSMIESGTVSAETINAWSLKANTLEVEGRSTAIIKSSDIKSLYVGDTKALEVLDSTAEQLSIINGGERGAARIKGRFDTITLRNTDLVFTNDPADPLLDREAPYSPAVKLVGEGTLYFWRSLSRLTLEQDAQSSWGLTFNQMHLEPWAQVLVLDLDTAGTLGLAGQQDVVIHGLKVREGGVLDLTGLSTKPALLLGAGNFIGPRAILRGGHYRLTGTLTVGAKALCENCIFEVLPGGDLYLDSADLTKCEIRLHPGGLLSGKLGESSELQILRAEFPEASSELILPNGTRLS